MHGRRRRTRNAGSRRVIRLPPLFSVGKRTDHAAAAATDDRTHIHTHYYYIHARRCCQLKRSGTPYGGGAAQGPVKRYDHFYRNNTIMVSDNDNSFIFNIIF